MTASLVLAVASDREVCMVRKFSKQLQGVTRFGFRHLGPVPLHKRCPLRGSPGSLGPFHDFEARRQDRKPYVVPVPGRELAFRNPTRRTTYGSDTHALSFSSRSSKPYNTRNQGRLLKTPKVVSSGAL